MEQQQVVPCWCWSTGMLGHEHHHDFPPKEGGTPFGIVFFWGNANGDLTLTWGVGMFLFKSTVTVGTSPMSCYLTINSSSWNFLPPLIFILIKKLLLGRIFVGEFLNKEPRFGWSQGPSTATIVFSLRIRSHNHKVRSLGPIVFCSIMPCLFRLATLQRIDTTSKVLYWDKPTQLIN